MSLGAKPGRKASHPRRWHANAQAEAGPLPARASGPSASLRAEAPANALPSARKSVLCSCAAAL
eukprot:9482606-Pyramimonas_sp.AAC.1